MVQFSLFIFCVNHRGFNFNHENVNIEIVIGKRQQDSS